MMQMDLLLLERQCSLSCSPASLVWLSTQQLPGLKVMGLGLLLHQQLEPLSTHPALSLLVPSPVQALGPAAQTLSQAAQRQMPQTQAAQPQTQMQALPSLTAQLQLWIATAQISTLLLTTATRTQVAQRQPQAYCLRLTHHVTCVTLHSMSMR